MIINCCYDNSYGYLVLLEIGNDKRLIGNVN